MQMTDENRPSPEQFLKIFQKEESTSKRGKLTIFLGMAAGVGKTYAMLEEAHQMLLQGMHLIVGLVDTHSRHETDLLLKGLKIIPPKAVAYREKEFKELDLDEVIRLKPQIVLIDELAHTNIPGVRHSKRWQDVIEILDNGIDVYTTLNVQHIESLKEIIERITGIFVRETVPDSIVEDAAFIHLIDLTPEHLIQRVNEGKVYLGEQSKVAIFNFFQKEKLTALREIVLRFAAEKIDHDLHDLVPSQEGWKTHEKLLVAIDHRPQSQKIIRSTRRLAFNLDAAWVALHVDDGKNLSEEENNQLAKNLALARDLGAEVETTYDAVIADGIQRIARQHGITQIVIGRDLNSSFFFRWFAAPTLRKLARECKDIDLHLVKQEKFQFSHRQKKMAARIIQEFNPYLLVFFCIMLLSFINWTIMPWVGDKLIGATFLISMLFFSLFFKKGPILFASSLYALVWFFFFIPSEGSQVITSAEETALVVVYFFTACMVGILVDRAKIHKEMLLKREESAKTLYDIVLKITSSPTMQIMLKTVVDKLEKVLHGKIEIIVKNLNQELRLDKNFLLLDSEKEKNSAIWVFEHGQEAGWSTDTLPSANNLYIPLKGAQGVLGVVIYRATLHTSLTIDQKKFLFTVCQQLANYLERSLSEAEALQTKQLSQVEKTHRMILAHLAREFKQPMSKIQDAITNLKESVSLADNPEFQRLENSFKNINQEFTNIAAMAQLIEGLTLKKELHSISYLIDESIKHLKTEKPNQEVAISIEHNLPQLFFDLFLVKLLICNLLFNAVDNSPPQSPIQIEAKKTGGFVVISVIDTGKGVPEDEIDSIFKKFYRLPQSKTPGVGLGLAISKTIAEIHNGFIKVENRPIRGAKFSLFLPIEI